MPDGRGRIIYDGDAEHATAMYMEHSARDNEVDKDLIHRIHAGNISCGIETGLCMEHLTLLGKDVPGYEQEDQELKLRITYSVSQAMAHLTFRLTIRTDTDIGLITAWTKEFDRIEPGTYTDDITVSIRNIAHGTFYGNIGFYQKNENGMLMILDHVTRAFKFERIGSVEWSTSTFGFIRLEADRQ